MRMFLDKFHSLKLVLIFKLHDYYIRLITVLKDWPCVKKKVNEQLYFSDWKQNH